MTHVRLTREEYAAIILSARANADGSYTLDVPDHLGPKARDGLPDNLPPKPPSALSPDEGAQRLSRAPSRILVQLGNFHFDSITGEAEYDTQEEFEQAHGNFNRVREQFSAKLPLARLTGGQFKVAYRGINERTGEEETKFAYFSLSRIPAKILEYVISAGGICSRLEVMNAIWTQEEQMRMKSGERAIYPHINKINNILEPYHLFIDKESGTLVLRQL